MKKNKIVTAMAAGLMFLGNAVPVYATDNMQTIDETTLNTQESVKVTYNTSGVEQFTITIPKKIVHEGDAAGNVGSYYSVNVDGFYSGLITVTPDATFNMSDGTTSVSCSVTQNKTEFSSPGGSAEGEINGEGFTPGAWEGTFDFAITYSNEAAGE